MTQINFLFAGSFVRWRSAEDSVGDDLGLKLVFFCVGMANNQAAIGHLPQHDLVLGAVNAVENRLRLRVEFFFLFDC